MKSDVATAEALREAGIAHVRYMLTELLKVLSAQSVPPSYHQTLMDADKLIESIMKL